MSSNTTEQLIKLMWKCTFKLVARQTSYSTSISIGVWPSKELVVSSYRVFVMKIKAFIVFANSYYDYYYYYYYYYRLIVTTLHLYFNLNIRVKNPKILLSVNLYLTTDFWAQLIKNI